MIVRKRLKWSIILKNVRWSLLYWTVLSGTAWLLYFPFHLTGIALPFAPIGVLGTALSIFLGFRNSSSYDRWWEARKIWGGIVNTSRTLARQVISLGTLHHTKGKVGEAELRAFHAEIIYRHLAWINALRLQLRHQHDEQLWKEQVYPFLTEKEQEELKTARNKTTMLILYQANRLSTCTQLGVFEDFRHIQLDNTLTELTSLQGQCERIKNTPLPRQYDFFNMLFTQVFIFMLPFGLLETFSATAYPAMLIPFTIITGFVFYIVEGVGRRNEDPFENKITDTPMTALCRTIEIDLRQMLGETELPPKVEPRDGFLY